MFPCDSAIAFSFFVFTAQRLGEEAARAAAADERTLTSCGGILAFRVPCDCVLVSGYGVTVDEAAVTGQSSPAPKQAATQGALLAAARFAATDAAGAAGAAGAALQARGAVRVDPFLLAGSALRGGSCVAVAFCVGPRTQLGRTPAPLAGTDAAAPQTPLAARLGALAKRIGQVRRSRSLPFHPLPGFPCRIACWIINLPFCMSVTSFFVLCLSAPNARFF
jgi:hypothetical protein